MKNLTDEKLVQIYLKGNEKALEEIVRRYLPLIYNFSRRYSGDADNASDIVQEVFVKVWKNIEKFDSSKNFKSWIFTIAKHAALDYLKKKNALPLSLIEEENADSIENIADPNQLPPLENFYKQTLSENLALAIGKLPVKYGVVIRLYHKKSLNFREISDLTDESINTIKSRYRRGMALLKKLL